MTFTVLNHVKNNFDGVLVFGDVHGDFDSIERAHTFAKRENLFFLSLGDLVDRGRKPFEVVKTMHDVMFEGHGAFVVGNHDDKHCRFAKGNKVSLSRDAKQTIEDVGVDRLAEFHRMYTAIVEDKMLSGFFHKFDDITVVHAASHPCMWEESPVLGKTEKSRFLVGETNGETMDDGYPVRLYNWTENVPMGKTVIVGHDKMPIHNVNITEPMVVSNSNGGKVIFLDTGCGKGGFLSGAVMVHGKRGFTVDRFVEFK